MVKVDNFINKPTTTLADFTLFDPRLPELHYNAFISIVTKIKSELPAQRVKLLDQYIKDIDNSEDLDDIKLITALSLLKDLLIQEWRIKLNTDNKVYLAPSPLVNTGNKFYLRQQLHIERDAQLQKDTVTKFIKKLETVKVYNGFQISIRNLIGNPQELLDRIKNQVDTDNLIQPYIQIVDKSKCEHTGYKLNEIWRYFRYTWSIPYKSTPGRNIFYLIRDASQPFHPIIGVSALGNSILQLSKRDNYIGWTLEAIKENLKQREKELSYEVLIKGGNGLTRNIHKKVPLETKDEYFERVESYSNKIIQSAIRFINNAIEEIYYKDLINIEDIENPQPSTLLRLEWTIEEAQSQQLNNKRAKSNGNLMEDALSPLFRKKRATELLKLLQAKMEIMQFIQEYTSPLDTLRKLTAYKGGRIINIALQANRKTKIGSNIMEIIVCGAIPPYNELLGGKLVSMLMTSPLVVSDYNKRYSKQLSEIASRMKGEPMIRDSRLAYLGTTSLYHIGSSQYNRIKIPTPSGYIKYKELGDTEGFGSVFFSEKTSSLINKMLIRIDGGRKINNVFGEGTSPRMRLMRSGLSALGIPDSFIKHHTKRIIYGVELAANTKEFLNGQDIDLNYYYPLDGNEQTYTQNIIDYWKKRWLKKRVSNPNVIERLNNFNAQAILVSNYL